MTTHFFLIDSSAGFIPLTVCPPDLRKERLNVGQLSD